MRRKIVKQGHNALTMTLPSHWTKKFNIKAGDEIEIKEDGKNLMVMAELGECEKTTTINIEKANQYLQHYPNNPFLRSIDVLYRLGYDEIKLEFDNAKIMSFIPEELNFLLGFEVIDQGKNFCIIKNIASGLDKQFDNILRRIFLVLQSMASDILEYVEKSEFKKLKSVNDLEMMNNKLTNFCERILNQKGYKDIRRTSAIYTMISLSEQIADDFRAICDYYNGFQKKFKFTKNSLDFFKEVINLIEEFIKLFYNFNRINLCTLTLTRHELIQRATFQLFKTQPKEEQVLLHYLTSIINKIYHMTEALIEFE